MDMMRLMAMNKSTFTRINSQVIKAKDDGGEIEEEDVLVQLAGKEAR